MGAANLASLPTLTGVVEQKYLIEPLNGPKGPRSYLDRFPDALYNKAPESHLVRFLYALLGPSGVGQLQTNFLQARLILEDHGVDYFDLEAFYGSPFQFGRLIEETYTSDPTGVLTQDEWDSIRAKDSSYRSRAIDFFNGVRAGNSPEGMRLVARSGLGYDVQIIENYRYLFDVISDSPLGLTNYGQTNSPQEFVVLPTLESSRSEVQQVTITGASGGHFQLAFRGGATASFGWADPETTATAPIVQAALEALPAIGVGNVKVTGGPSLVGATVLVDPYSVLFTANLGARDVPALGFINNLTGGSPTVAIETITNGIDSSQETVSIAPQSLHSLQVALDRIRPVATLPTVYQGSGTRHRQVWAAAASSNEGIEVLRYVTGQAGVAWPQGRSFEWIEKNVEKQGPRSAGALNRGYQGFHDAVSAVASSSHVGAFSPAQVAAFPPLGQIVDDTLVYTADRCLADYASPLVQTSTIDDAGASVAMFQDIYPAEYLALPGVPSIRYRDEQFWASQEATDGTETLVLDLGTAQAINFLQFEVTGKPLLISIDYDTADNGDGSYVWQSVSPDLDQPYPDSVGYAASNQNPWVSTTLHFTDAKAEQIFTRYIRASFLRSTSGIAPFLEGGAYSVDVRNLRLGRNVA